MTRILLVEDDPMLSRALVRMLTKVGGFEVTTADSEEVALDFLSHDSDDFELVLTDLALGSGGSGLVVVEACKKLGMPVILHSGSFNEATRPRDIPTFDKPADQNVLIRAIHDAILGVTGHLTMVEQQLIADLARRPE